MIPPLAGRHRAIADDHRGEDFPGDRVDPPHGGARGGDAPRSADVPRAQVQAAGRAPARGPPSGVSRPANHYRVKPAGDSAGQPLNRVFARHRATAARITINGHEAYGVYVAAGTGYRDDTGGGSTAPERSDRSRRPICAGWETAGKSRSIRPAGPYSSLS
jgi:hypothetical protein